jgi:dTDP-4-dehydrorhamnose reductase
LIGTKKIKIGGKTKLVSENRQKWIIFGAKGQLGIELARKLYDLNIDVFEPKSQEIDVGNQESVFQYVLAVQPDFIFNAAAWTNVDSAEKNIEIVNKVNAIGPKNLAIVSKNIGARLIHISTDYIFSGNRAVPWEINSPALPLTVYGKSKLLGEKYVREIHLDGAYIFRTSWLFSEHRKNFVKAILKKALFEKDDVRVVGDQIGSPTSTSDLVERVLTVVEKKLPTGTYHFSNSGQASWFEFAREIFELCGSDSRRIKAIKSTDYESLTPRPEYSVLSNRCWNEFGLTPTRDWRQALAEKLPAAIDNVMREKYAN